MEISAENVVFGCLDLRVRLWEKIYTTFISNAGVYYDQANVSNLMVGGGLSVSYDSVVGPVEFILSTSNLNRNVTPYFSLGYCF
jgi:NTE family protein